MPRPRLDPLSHVSFPRTLFKEKMWSKSHKSPSPTTLFKEKMRSKSLSLTTLFKESPSPTTLFKEKMRLQSLSLTTLFKEKMRSKSLTSLDLEQSWV